MNTKAAKDYLVQQTVEQAALEHVPLTDLETRMMYFTESDPASCADPIALNDEFEQEYEMPEYEAKMSRLLHHAYKRLKQEDPEKLREWNEAMRVLHKGDHYILVLCDTEPPTAPGDRPPHDSLKLLGTGLLVAAGLVAASFLAAQYSFDFDRYKKYFPILLVLAVLLVTGAFPAIYRLLLMWFRRETKQSKAPN
jgi:hypothetical protein